jgi:hypothetical protein
MFSSFTVAILVTAAYALNLNAEPVQTPPANATQASHLNLKPSDWQNFCVAWEDADSGCFPSSAPFDSTLKLQLPTNLYNWLVSGAAPTTLQTTFWTSPYISDPSMADHPRCMKKVPDIITAQLGNLTPEVFAFYLCTGNTDGCKKQGNQWTCELPTQCTEGSVVARIEASPLASSFLVKPFLEMDIFA